MGGPAPRDSGPPASLRGFAFDEFLLDAATEQLWHQDRLVAIKPKAFAVLRYLLENSQRLVTKAELLERVWQGVHVSDSVLKAQLRDIRIALGDDASSPRFIATTHRRGYRFIAPVSKLSPEPASDMAAASLATFVGRAGELSRLSQAFAAARLGRRHVIFVTGPPGIGKTSLIEAFCAEQLARDGIARFARGQCVDQYGAGEAYLPLLEALSRLGRGPERDALVAVLSRHAPSWLHQLPELLAGTRLTPQPTVGLNAAPERMLREMAEALEVFARDKPLILLLEDVHWADPSTLTWIAYVARRTDSTRLLLLATYRPLEIETGGRGLAAVKRELEIQQRCLELAVPFFSAQDVAAYLAERFAPHRFPSELAALLSARTGGNPLFLVNLLDSWTEQGSIVSDGREWRLAAAPAELLSSIPASVVSLIESESSRLPPFEREVLEAASVAGCEFSTASLAAALERDIVVIEDVCLRWVRRRQFLRQKGKTQWPDGTLAMRCEFMHAIYQQTCYESIVPARQAQLHQRIGERQAAAYGERAHEVAAELALHFERGGDRERALRHMLIAGEQALARSAYREAVEHFERALNLLPSVADEPLRLRMELELQVALGAPLGMTLGHAAPEVERRYARARELCRAIGETQHLAQTLTGILLFYLARGQYRSLCELAMPALLTDGPGAERASCGDGAARAEGEAALENDILVGAALTFMGRLGEAHARLRRAIERGDEAPRPSRLQMLDARAFGRGLLGVTLWLLGYPDQAIELEAQTLAMGKRQQEPSTIAMATTLHVFVLHIARDPRARGMALAGIEFCAQQGLPYYHSELRLLASGRTGEADEGSPERAQAVREAWDTLQAIGAEIAETRVQFMLALALAGVGSLEAAVRQLLRGLELARESDERWWEPELYRVLGIFVQQTERVLPELADRHGLPVSVPLCVEACYTRALELARGMQAKSLELRAALSLARWWHLHGKASDAHQLLSEAYGWFTEGFGTRDLVDARDFLRELERALPEARELAQGGGLVVNLSQHRRKGRA